MPLWLIPMAYTIGSVLAGFLLPQLEHAYLPTLNAQASVGAAMAFFSAVSSGMMALTGVVFAIAFVAVQFGAVAYSPRLVVTLVNDPRLFHALGLFFATFTYALAALIWTDRQGSGHVPFVSGVLVVVLLVVSLLAFALLVQSLGRLQIHEVLRAIGDKGRTVIAGMFPLLGEDPAAPGPESGGDFGLVRQVLRHEGAPRCIASLDVAALVGLARQAEGVIRVECAVGETLVGEATMLRLHGAMARPLPEAALRRTFRLAATRTFEQDPRYALRLLVDIAIRALSPAVNDPTTAVQALDQIEDLLRRLGRRRLDAGRVHDADGRLCLVFPTAVWEDYLDLAFDEIRQYGATSLQVVRRLRAALVGLAESLEDEKRREAVLRHLTHLDLGIGRAGFDDLDRKTALDEDRQGLGMTRRPEQPTAAC